MWQGPRKAPFRGLAYIWPDSTFSVGKPYPQGIWWKQSLFNITAAWGRNTSVGGNESGQRSWKENLENEMSLGLWKTLTYFSRHSHTHTELNSCPEKTWKSHEVSPLAELEALCKQELKAKAELSPACWNIADKSQHTHRGLRQRWETYCLKVFKEISV